MSVKIRNTYYKGGAKQTNEGMEPSFVSNCTNGLYECYDEEYDSDIMRVMHNKAVKLQKEGENSCSYYIKVTPVRESNGISYFTIENTKSVDEASKSYTIYKKGTDIYYRSSDEFYQLMQDMNDGIKQVKSLTESYNGNKSLDRISCINNIDCMFMVQTIVLSITGITENCKIRRPGLKVNGDYVNNSKFYDEVKNGEKDVKDFEEEIDKECTKAGIDNPLLGGQGEENASFKRILPNAHNVISENKIIGDVEIIFEQGDRVMYKNNPAIVLSVDDNNDTARIQTSNGKKDVDTRDLEPDPKYMDNIDIDNTEDDELVNPEKIDTSDMNDLSAKTVDCNIIVDGYKVNMYECKASLSDIMKSRKNIRVIFENDDIEEFDKDNIEFIERPYAVVVDSDGKPVRTIQIDPTSYINADESSMVDCLVAGKETSFPKSVIRILS